MSDRQRRQLRLLADELERGEDLRPQMRDFLVSALTAVSEGRDANEVLGVKRKRGQSASDEEHRRNLAIMFHLIVSITQKPPEGFGLSNEQAFEAVSELSNGRSWSKPEADCYLDQELGELFGPITPEALHKAWYDPKNADLQKLDYSQGDFDFPYDLITSPPNR